MQTKELIRKGLGAAPVATVLRAINSSPRLSEDQRAAMYRRVTKKIASDPEVLFSHRVPTGRTVSIHLDGTIRRLHWTGTYETDALPLFTSYARDSDVILDIGAAEGIYSLFAAAVSPSVTIVAFEASPGEQSRFRANVAVNAELTDGRVHLRTEALADHDGTADFWEVRGGTSSLNPGFRPGAVPLTVAVRTGDAVVGDLTPGRVDLVKIDTESTEPAVLRGLNETVERDRPAIFCEVLHGRSEAELQALIDRWDYRTYWLSGEGAVARPRIEGDPSNRYVNCLFLPDDRGPRAPAPLR